MIYPQLKNGNILNISIYDDQVERSSHRNDSLVTRLDETLACLSHCEAKARRKDDLIRRTVDSLLQSEGENQ